MLGQKRTSLICAPPEFSISLKARQGGIRLCWPISVLGRSFSESKFRVRGNALLPLLEFRIPIGFVVLQALCQPGSIDLYGFQRRSDVVSGVVGIRARPREPNQIALEVH